MDRRPAAILALSAHTLAPELALLGAPRHEAVYDFGGFDPRLRTLRYDAPGAPDLASRVQAHLASQGWAKALGRTALRLHEGAQHGMIGMDAYAF